MRRRDFNGLFSGAALAWPLAVPAQSAALPVVGFLNGGSPGPFAHLVAAYREGLAQAGFTEGRNVAIEYRWAEGRYERLPELAADLVRRRVAVLVTTGGENSTFAAKAATSSIPIVFAAGGHPVDLGLVASLGRPDANLTGLTQYTGPLEGKRLGLLRELVPSAATIAVLINPTFANAAAQWQDIEEGARRLGVQLLRLPASAEADFEPAFASLVQQRVNALLVSADPFFNTRRDRLVALAARNKILAIYEFREFTAAGGLMSYGTNLADGYRKIGAYTGRILQGSRPADLPVLQPTRFEFVINLRTAKTLGIKIPQSVLLRADEVIR
ncbi:MAG: ABC transporter substrate-binding protein [Burkholderiaceae bacterium]